MADIADPVRPAGEPQPAQKTVSDLAKLHRGLDDCLPQPLQPSPLRCAMAPQELDLSWKRNLSGRGPVVERAEAAPWQAVVDYRQRVTFVLALGVTAGAVLLSNAMLRAQQMPDTTRMLYLVVYGVMTFFLAGNFFKMTLGTWHMLRGAKSNPWHPSRTACDPPAGDKVAIVFPVYHEEVGRVAAGLAATWESILEGHPDCASHFDFFLLSDSRDIAHRIAEEVAVHTLRAAFPTGRFFYRWRTMNQNAKLGNIEDFCRRWGRRYEYMLVMDADSVMDGDAIVAMHRMMAGNDRIGILQTNPRPILRTSLFGRMQQFSARLYGSVFSYGLQAMFMGNASYIGHNALVRVAPFVRHCVLPELSGPKPWGGKPLSHDIVESALMVRAGYEVWFLAEMSGSYEEIPANILAFLVRERRWMQGNLQHLRFLCLRGLRSIHRETFLNGSMGYCSAPLWAAFLVISAYGMLHFMRFGMLAIGSLRSIQMPMIMLSVSALIFLFLPRAMALAIHIRSDRAKLFGGKGKLIWSVVLETLFSFFFSPLMMIYITRFLWLWLKRKGISWGTQSRGDEPLSWDQCWRHFGWVSLLGLTALALMVIQVWQVPFTQQVMLSSVSGGWLHPKDILLWFSPIIGGFSASVWIARATSRTYPSLLCRRLFCIPEETDPPAVVRSLEKWAAYMHTRLPDERDADGCFSYAVSDPQFYLWHRRQTRIRPLVAAQFVKKIRNGEALTAHQMSLALGERECFDVLHERYALRR